MPDTYLNTIDRNVVTPVAGAAAKVPKLWQEYVSSRPLVESGVLGGAGAVGGYYGSGLLAKGLLNTIMAGKSDEEKAEQWQQWENEGFTDTIRNVGGAAGGLAGLAYPMFKNYNGKIESLTEKNYYANHPEEAAARAKASPLHSQYRDTGVFERYKELNKHASFDMAFDNTSSIPVQGAMDMFWDDPHLSHPERTYAAGLVSAANQDQPYGVLSPSDLALGAVRAGVSFGIAKSFANVVGNAMKLPSDVRDRMSNAGGIAAAVMSTGILNKVTGSQAFDFIPNLFD